jgi:hypothetical protein
LDEVLETQENKGTSQVKGDFLMIYETQMVGLDTSRIGETIDLII